MKKELGPKEMLFMMGAVVVVIVALYLVFSTPGKVLSTTECEPRYLVVHDGLNGVEWWTAAKAYGDEGSLRVTLTDGTKLVLGGDFVAVTVKNDTDLALAKVYYCLDEDNMGYEPRTGAPEGGVTR